MQNGTSFVDCVNDLLYQMFLLDIRHQSTDFYYEFDLRQCQVEVVRPINAQYLRQSPACSSSCVPSVPWHSRQRNYRRSSSTQTSTCYFADDPTTPVPVAVLLRATRAIP